MTTTTWHYNNPPQRDSGSCSHSWIYHFKKRPITWHPMSGPPIRTNRRFAQRKICSKCGLRMQRIGDEAAVGKTVQWEPRGYAGYAPCEREHVFINPALGKTFNFAPMYGHDEVLVGIPLDEKPCPCGNRLGHPFSDCPPRIRRLRNILIF